MSGTETAFHFDLASPLAYLAAEQVLQVLASPPGVGAPIEWRPVLARDLTARPAPATTAQYDGARAAESVRQRDTSADRQRDTSAGRQRDTSAERQRDTSADRQRDISAERQRDISAERQRDTSADRDVDALRERVERGARELGLQPLRWPQPFPFDSALAMRVATYAASIGRAVAFAQAAFRQAFAGGHSLEDPDFVLIAAAACEMHPAAVLRGAGLRATAERLAAATATAASAGVTEVPAITVGERVFQGEHALERAAAWLHGTGVDGAGVDGAGVDRACVDRAGVDGAGVDGAGVDRAGVDRASADGAGVDGRGQAALR